MTQHRFPPHSHGRKGAVDYRVNSYSDGFYHLYPEAFCVVGSVAAGNS